MALWCIKGKRTEHPRQSPPCFFGLHGREVQTDQNQKMVSTVEMSWRRRVRVCEGHGGEERQAGRKEQKSEGGEGCEEEDREGEESEMRRREAPGSCQL